jgi:peptide/nickel transport system permease protein
MAGFLLRRTLFILLTMLAASGIAFILTFASGDPATMLVPRREGEIPDPEIVAQFREQYGLDQPLPVQYVRYVEQLLQGNLGTSLYYRRPVRDLFVDKFPNTLLLAVLAVITALVIGLPVGALAAVRRNTLTDRIIVIICAVLIAVPAFLLALVLVFFAAFQWKLLPMSGTGSPGHLVLPVFSVALPLAAGYVLLLRTNMLNQVNSDYARTARAKGLLAKLVAIRHVLPNALIPVATVVSLDFAYLLTGIVLVESVFSYPGIGLQALQAVRNRDVPVVMATVLLGSLLIGIGSLAADLVIARLDPRIRLRG